MGVCNCSMFCCTLLCVRSSIAIILMGKRELGALLNLSSWCLVMVERLFLTVPRGCLRFVIVVFPDHTHLLFLLNQVRPRFLLRKPRVRCTINRSHSTPCKKGRIRASANCYKLLLGLFSASEWQNLSFTYQNSEKATYLDNLVFSVFSVLWGTVKTFRLKSHRHHTLPGECAGESVTK